MVTHYQILGISQNAGEAEIKHAYRALAMQFHPDRNSAPDASRRFIEIQNAYDILMNESQRASYDTILSSGFDFSTTISETDNYDPPIDPFTGRKNYKYHRGKPRQERDLNAPFENFETKSEIDFEADFEVVSRVALLAIPGFFASCFIFTNIENLQIGDLFFTGPFVIFHICLFFDCLLPTQTFYGLLTKVVKGRYSNWQELFVKTTSNSTSNANYFDNRNKTWFTDRIYVYESWVDYSNVQQFFIHRSLVFKIKFQIFGIVNDKLVDLKLNHTKNTILLLSSLIQIAVLLFFFTVEEKNGAFYLPLIFTQLYYIWAFLVSSKQSHNDQLNHVLRWF